jgi:hypothetical protein
VVRAGAVVWRAPFVNLASWAWRPSYLLVAIAKKAFRQASMTADLRKTTSENWQCLTYLLREVHGSLELR